MYVVAQWFKFYFPLNSLSYITMHAPKQRKKLNQEENRTTTYICISTVNIFGEKEAIFFFIMVAL